MNLRTRNKRFQQTVRSMPLRSRVLLAVAIFTTFTALSFWGTSLSLASGFWNRVVASALFSGIVGLGYAAVGFGYRIMLPIVIVVNVFGSLLMGRWMPARDPSSMSAEQVRQAEARLNLVGTVRIVLSLVAYSSFIAVLRLEGERSIGAHTEIRLAREIHASLVPLTSRRAGDLVAVVTDGLIEVFNRRQHELGADGLLRIVEVAARQARLSEAAAEIFAECAKFGDQTDDQSLLLVRRAA